ncbi:MAG: NADH-quinone oxidoreductase subunit L [Chloroflexi bacterium]|nr:NADH-quinone oxidoreductase subunit L [Chloroflexota bacterium]
MTGADYAFWVFAILGGLAALGVVMMRNLFRAALLLVLCFFTVAGIYGSLSADFLAVAQVLVYMGAISVLIIFAVMLTRDMRRGNPFNRAWPSVLVVCGFLMAGIIYVVVETTWPTVDVSPAVTGAAIKDGTSSTAAIAETVFDKDSGFLLPFEIAGMLILAAVIGAVALVRDK